MRSKIVELLDARHMDYIRTPHVIMIFAEEVDAELQKFLVRKAFRSVIKYKHGNRFIYHYFNNCTIQIREK